MSADMVEVNRKSNGQPEEEEEVGYETDLSKTKLELSWGRIVYIGLSHVGALYAIYLRCGDSVSVYTEIFMKLNMIFTFFGMIIGYHKLWSHRAFKASKTLEILLLIAVSGTFQYSVFHWARDHRVHHKFSDTNADPHNPSRGFFFSHVGWMLVKKQKDVVRKGKEVDCSDLKNNPIVMFQHKYYAYFLLTFHYFLPTFIPWYFWGESLSNAFYICVIYKLVVNLNMISCVNSFGHTYGYKPYDAKIGPTDNPIGWVVLMGEGYHNYHHTFPSDYRSSEFSLDCRNAATMIIDMFYKLGMASDLKTADKSLVNIWREKYGDHSNDSSFLDNFFSKQVQEYITQLQYFTFITLFLYYI